MTLSNGTKLGPYEIVAPLGAGGMGEVYRAKDTRLDREVAIKVLPEVFARDPERVQRFQREAKVLASLNHPNIAAIYGFEDHRLETGTTHFLVMELVEGDTLTDRLTDGTMPMAESLKVGKQMAEALEAAHERGIIHRDLKPANVKITPDGQVKVLDFGLAKAMTGGAEASQTDVANSPTITADFTRPGVILGTAAYMSPEQARGKPIDKRTDIWSFGCVLYQCLGGQRPFDGETTTDMIAKILERDPDWSVLPPETPPIVNALLQRCLQKDRKERLRDIGEAWVVLNGALSGDLTGIALTPYEGGVRAPAWRRVLPWCVAGVLAVALAAVWITTRPKPQPVMRFALTIPDETPLRGHRWPMFAISPDGTRVVYVARDASDRRQLYLRHIHQTTATPLANTGGAQGPIFSPDGNWIAFAQDGRLKKISVLGGPAVTICEAAELRGASWGRDGTIVFAPTRASGIWRVASAGGAPEKLTDPGTGSGNPSHRWPYFLPDAKTVLFTATENNDNYQNAEIVALSLDTMEQKTVIRGGTFARYLPTGHLVFGKETTLLAVPFDARKLQTVGQPVPIEEGVYSAWTMGNMQYAFSETGTCLFLAGAGSTDEESLVWLDRTGQETQVSDHVRDFANPRLSSDGSRIVFELDDGRNVDLWMLEVERDMLLRLTFNEAVDVAPLWSPDDEWVVFNSNREEGRFNIFRRRADGTGGVERLTTSEHSQAPHSFSPDGSILVFVQATQGGDIMLLPLDADPPEPRPFLATPIFEFDPAVSPDGKWLAYGSDETGSFEVYVQPFPEGGRRVKVSSAGGSQPRWRADGSELFFRTPSKFFAAAVTVTDGEFKADLPDKLFDVSRAGYAWWYDVAPDGERFLFGRRQNANLTQRQEPTVVVNWFDELNSKVPVGR